MATPNVIADCESIQSALDVLEGGEDVTEERDVPYAEKPARHVGERYPTPPPPRDPRLGGEAIAAAEAEARRQGQREREPGEDDQEAPSADPVLAEGMARVEQLHNWLRSVEAAHPGSWKAAEPLHQKLAVWATGDVLDWYRRTKESP